ncbi:uncharacterized protein BDR25DRAFT_369933 [Lindgomyces ingoldianus]|uniref:Uncharacterized protein n=1 Tax=Lindgomyces ingoldianus TaxID=673940 RepID=A0ACB6QVA2_9PLEO|nr:uncharacterized protein BDR25DRAFT_369933 [Lindgomyces ingoldianus]KAF2470002.1 hypothetical protein BDR25DRAFT_369933 [Lindgomyces ingoldianus]
MRPSPLTLLLSVAAASPLTTDQSQSSTQCPLIFDGRIPVNLTLSSFDSATTSPYSPSYVKGENLTWSSILLLPNSSTSYTPSRFDIPSAHKPFEVTISDASLFRSGQGLQLGFRRAGLLLRDDKNEVGGDAADKGVVTFHWSVAQDEKRAMNLSHEYMNVWHERADYAGNQFSLLAGVVLVQDGGNGVDTKAEREMWKVVGRNNTVVFRTPIQWAGWENWAVQLDYEKSTLQVFYSVGNDPLKSVTDRIPNDNSGGGQLQLGMAKKPTETKTVVWDGYQEPLNDRTEGQKYGGVFVEDSSGGCVSL